MGKDRERDRERERESRSHGDKDSKHVSHKHKSTRTHHHHHHHHSRHHQSRDRTAETQSPRTSHKTNKDPRTSVKRKDRQKDSGRHPSSSVGPGKVEPVLIVITVLLGISAAALIGVSIWLYAVRNGWPSGLNQTGSIAWTRFISFATACLIVGILLIPIIIISIIASITSSGSSARKLRLALVFLTSVSIVILVMMTVTALLFASNGPLFISNASEQAWTNTVKSPNFRVACHIQNVKKCQGWADNSCRGCKPLVSGDYTGCSTEQQSICPRCFERSTKKAVRAYTVSSLPQQSLTVGREHRQSKNGVKRIGSRAVEAGKRATKRLKSKIWRQTGTDSEDFELGCFRYIAWRNREFFIPMAVYSIFLVLLLTLLQWKACIDSSGR